jgi:iron complex transport system permease protein
MIDPLRRASVLACFASLLALLAAVTVWALGAGAYAIPWSAFRDAALGDVPLSPVQRSVLLSLRLPRALAAIVVGGGLAVAGCTFQAILRNPLADPGFIGVSAGAAVVAAACVAGMSFISWIPLPPSVLISLAALIGALASAGLIMRIARIDGQMQAATLLLAGLAINALCGGLLGLIAYSADDPSLRAITMWLFGSLSRAGWPELAVGMPAIIAGALLLWRCAPSLNALLLGEAEAQHLGVDVRALRLRSIALAVWCTAVSVALAGIIGFVGLMVPHMLRMWVGPDHRLLIPLSAIGGGALLLLADTLARVIAQPAEIPVGIACALLGAPFFLGLLLRWRRAPELT